MSLMKTARLSFVAMLALAALLLLLSSSRADEKYLQPTGRAASVLEQSSAFAQYVLKSRENILAILEHVRGENPYLGNYAKSVAAEMRAPFELLPDQGTTCSDSAAGGRKGFLLIHGLTDSPYLMRSVADSLHQAYPCSLIRAVLLPGHGTVVGDSLDMTREDWKKIVRYGIHSFQGERSISDLYLVGFSTGTSLIIDYLHHHPAGEGQARQDLVKGLVLLSTAVKAKSGVAFLSPLLRPFKKWLSVFHERDAARYESFSINAAAEFYLLTKDMVEPEYAIKLPFFMAVSADDATIDAQAARRFFCMADGVRKKELVWYRSIDEKLNRKIAGASELSCDNITEVGLEGLPAQYRTVNIAHTAIPIAPTDAHYGVQGRYHNCREYDTAKSMNDFEKCQQADDQAVFGEDMKLLRTQGKLENRYFRRGTFNPDYDNLMRRILRFVDGC